MEGQTAQTQIIDLMCGEVAEVEEAGVPVLAHCNHDRIGSGLSQTSTSQTVGPITRYVMSSFTGLTLPIMVPLD